MSLRNHRSWFAMLALAVGAGSAAAEPPAELQWWTPPAGSNGQAAAQAVPPAERDGLAWWEAERSRQALSWWSDRAPAIKPVAARQQSPAVEPSVPVEPPRGDVKVDPLSAFDVTPDIRPLSAIGVSLAPDPRPADAGDESIELGSDFSGSAEEFFAQHGTLHLGTHLWPNRTPEAAAYQFCSRPLWYEDANLERCGYTCGCLQPAVSGAYFFANTTLLPYRFVAEPQCHTVPQKQFCPPGCRYTCRQNYLPPWSPAGALAEGAAVTGLIFLVP